MRCPILGKRNHKEPESVFLEPLFLKINSDFLEQSDILTHFPFRGGDRR